MKNIFSGAPLWVRCRSIILPFLHGYHLSQGLGLGDYIVEHYGGKIVCRMMDRTPESFDRIVYKDATWRSWVNQDKCMIGQIGHAFGYYDYGIETGLVSLFSGRDDVATYICGYVRAALQSGLLHTVGEGKEAFIAYKCPGERASLRAVWPLLKAVCQSMNLSQMLRFVRLMQTAGPGTEDQFKKAKEQCIFVGMVCVLEPYQGQGYMRRLLELAFAEGDRLGVPVILETDAVSKCDKYVHLGMELVLTRDLGEYGKIYDLIRYPAGKGSVPEKP